MRNLRGYGKRNGNSAEEVLKNFGVSNESAQKYAGLSEDELADELIKSVRESKRNGTFDAARMQAFVQMVSPRLSPEKREKLESIIKVISAD